MIFGHHFTEKAQRALAHSQEEARSMGHNYVGTEHLLLGLLHEGGGVATATLTTLGVGIEAARERIMTLVEIGRAHV